MCPQQHPASICCSAIHRKLLEFTVPFKQLAGYLCDMSLLLGTLAHGVSLNVSLTIRYIDDHYAIISADKMAGEHLSILYQTQHITYCSSLQAYNL